MRVRSTPVLHLGSSMASFFSVTCRFGVCCVTLQHTPDTLIRGGPYSVDMTSKHMCMPLGLATAFAARLGYIYCHTWANAFPRATWLPLSSQSSSSSHRISSCPKLKLRDAQSLKSAASSLAKSISRSIGLNVPFCWAVRSELVASKGPICGRSAAPGVVSGAGKGST